MIHRILSLLNDGIRYVRQEPQILLTLTLVLVIPFAFWYTARDFKDVGRANQTRLEHDRIGILHDVFVSLIYAADGDSKILQEEIMRIGSQNPDITLFRVAKETVNGIVPIAALDLSAVGITDEADIYRLAYTHPDESLIVEYFKDDERYEQGVRLVQFADETFFIRTEVSRAELDALLRSREIGAYFTLVFVLVIVMALVLRHVFIINYGYLYKEAKRAIQTKDMFTNMIAHELRAPLTAVRGYASMIREKPHVDSDTKAEAKRIEESSERLITIVNDLLDVARIQSGKIAIEKKETDLADIVRSVLDSLRASAEMKHIELKTEGMHGMFVISTDGKRLHQALTNLVSNAIKYTPKGSITVALEQKRDRVELRVKDTGMGIDAEHQRELFAPFFRVQNESVEKITGTGLGMWITKQLIELMGGSIAVESIKGVGTHVVITLPFK